MTVNASVQPGVVPSVAATAIKSIFGRPGAPTWPPPSGTCSTAAAVAASFFAGEQLPAALFPLHTRAPRDGHARLLRRSLRRQMTEQARLRMESARDLAQCG